MLDPAFASIKMQVQEIISKVPPHSVIVFDEVPLTSKVNLSKRMFSYDWSSLENRRSEEVTAVVCLQPIRIAPTFRAKAHTVIGPKDADVIVGILQSPFWQDTKKSGHFSAFLMLVDKTVQSLL